MGDELRKLTSKLGIDTTDFKRGIVEADRNLRALESSFKAGASTMADWSKDASGLEMRIKSLTSQIDIQKLKVDVLRAEHQRMVEANGATSRSALDAEIKLNKQTEALGKMETELKKDEQALNEMKNSSDDAGKGIQGMDNATGSLTKKLGLLSVTIPGLSSETGVLEFAIGGVIVEINLLDVAVAVIEATLAALVVVVAAVAAAFVALVAASILAVKGITDLEISSADAADQLAELSAQTGISTDKLQEMNYAGKLLGTSLETFTGSQAKMIRSMEAARKGTGAQADTFAALGIKVTDANGHLRDSQTVFGDVLDALKRIKDPTERDAMAMTIFGKSAQELNPLIDAGSDGLKKYADEAKQMGAVVDENTVGALSGLKDQMDSLDLGLKGVGMTIAGVFLPYFTGIASAAQTQLAGLASAVQGSAGLSGTTKAVSRWFIDAANEFARTAPGGVKQMVGDLEKNLPTLIKSVVTAISTVAGAVLQATPQLLEAGLQAMIALGQGIQSNLPGLIAQLAVVLPQIIQQLSSDLPSLINMGANILTTLINGFSNQMPTIIPNIANLIKLVLTAIVKNLPVLIDAGTRLLTALVMGITAAQPILIPLIPQLIKIFVDGLYQNRNSLIEAGGELISAILLGIVDEIPYMLEGIATMLGSVLEVLFYFISGQALMDVGIGLVKGIWAGIQREWATLLQNLQGLISQIPSGILSLLGLNHSLDGLQASGQALGQSFSQALGDFRPGLATAGAGGSVSQVQNDNFGFNNYGTVNLHGPQTPGSISARLKQKRF